MTGSILDSARKLFRGPIEPVDPDPADHAGPIIEHDPQAAAAKTRGAVAVPMVQAEGRSVPETYLATRQEFAAAIGQRWQSSIEAIIATGRLIAQAKATLAHGEFGEMIASDLPFVDRTARKLMAIAEDQRIAKRTHESVLPPSWTTLYELTKLDDDAFQARLEDGTIRPDMQRRDIAQVVKKHRRAERERELADNIKALPEEKFGVIYADPEWRFEPYSRDSGMDRAADNHYPTSAAAVIADRPVADIAADDCVLFLWATAPMLQQALAVMEAWGFAYKSHVIWRKAVLRPDATDQPDRRDRGQGSGALMLGNGYWFRSGHELLLVGTRGNVVAPAMGDQFPSVIDAPATKKHSEKPARFAEMIEAYFPNIPKIELNRRGRARPGWSAWGNEAESAAGATGNDHEEAESAAGATGNDHEASPAPAATPAAGEGQSAAAHAADGASPSGGDEASEAAADTAPPDGDPAQLDDDLTMPDIPAILDRSNPDNFANGGKKP